MKNYRQNIALLFALLFIFGWRGLSEANDAAQGSIDTVIANPGTGIVNADNINIRADSTVSSPIIGKVNSGQAVTIISEKYDWYKIKLPRTAESYIRKDMVEVIGDYSAKLARDNVNIRILPDESSEIIGKAGKNEVLTIVGESGSWYKIEPTANSYGWLHKRFVDKTARQTASNKIITAADSLNLTKRTAATQTVEITGVIKPYGKVLGRMATHKLICPDKKVYFLKGNPKNLDALLYQKAKVYGRIINSDTAAYPVIEVEKMELPD